MDLGELKEVAHLYRNSDYTSFLFIVALVVK